MEFTEIAAVLASGAYARASTALVAGFEGCDDFQPLRERQKAVLVANLVSHLQGLEVEFVQVLEAARRRTPSLVEDLTGAVRPSFPRPS